MADLSKSIYLAGSFNSDFRDRITAALPETSFVDPRRNRQFAMWATNADDLEAAVKTPTTLSYFEGGKDYSVMTFVELGAAYESGSDLIVVNPNSHISPEAALLRQVATAHFTSAVDNELIDYLKSYSLPDKKIVEHPEKKGPVSKVYLAGQLIATVLADAIRFSDKTFHYDKSGNMAENLAELRSCDLLVVNFPSQIPHSRLACFMMGVAAHNKIPIAVLTDRKVPYPPLTGGLQRRLFTDPEPLTEYLTTIKSNDIGHEAKIMYGLFTKYDGVM